MADFIFSDYADGAPYSDRARALGETDRDVARRLAIPTVTSSLVVEGGSITVNGLGTLIVSELTQRRNPQLKKSKIEAELLRVLGQKKITWLNEGLFTD